MKQRTSGYERIGDLHMYCEVHGGGAPLLLLHGAFGTAATFDGLLPTLTRSRTVFVPEQQGHGHTADLPRPLSFVQMASDTAVLLERRGVERCDVLGYSSGATVAMHLALRHPRLVRRLILASAACNLSGYTPEIARALRDPRPEALPPALRQSYAAVAPHPERWSELVTKMGALAQSTDEREVVEVAALGAIQSPTLLVIGDRDIIRRAHAEEMAQSLGARLVVIRGDHVSYLTTDTVEFSSEIESFLDGA